MGSDSRIGEGAYKLIGRGRKERELLVQMGYVDLFAVVRLALGWIGTSTISRELGVIMIYQV